MLERYPFTVSINVQWNILNYYTEMPEFAIWIIAQYEFLHFSTTPPPSPSPAPGNLVLYWIISKDISACKIILALFTNISGTAFQEGLHTLNVKYNFFNEVVIMVTNCLKDVIFLFCMVFSPLCILFPIWERNHF